MDCTRLGSFSMVSLIRAPAKQPTSSESVLGQQMRASIPFSRKPPTTTTRHFFLVALVLFGVQIGLPYMAPASLPM